MRGERRCCALTRETWEFTAPGGEHLEATVAYEPVPVNRASRETRYFSAKNPGSYQISKADSGLEIARNATIDVPNRVKEFRYKASGGRFGALFDGTEKVLSIDMIPWFNQSVFVP